MTFTRRRSTSLRAQLVSNAIQGVAVPIVVTGALAFFLLSYHLDIIETSFARSRDVLTNTIVRTDLIARASDVARRIDSFLISRITEARSWASAGVVVDAAVSAQGKHAAQDLTSMPVGEIESRFKAQKSLGLWPDADFYLRQQVAASPYFAEIFFTDSNGFNVSLTNPTSDFVQSDEGWWQKAWSEGISIGEVEYDKSAAVWSVDIAIRIDRPGTKTPLGVMKTVLAIEPIQKIADRAAQIVPGGRVQVATPRGALIAETSTGHARERIMNPDVNVKAQGEPSVRESFGAQPTGFAIDEAWLTGYARSGGRETYSSTVSRFAGFDWIVILQKPVASIQAPIAALRGIEDALREWPLLLGLALGAMLILSTAFAVALALGAARRYTAALDAVRDLAERSAQGEQVRPAAIEHPEELVRVNDAVHRLGQMFNGILDRNGPARSGE